MNQTKQNKTKPAILLETLRKKKDKIVIGFSIEEKKYNPLKFTHIKAISFSNKVDINLGLNVFMSYIRR